MTDKQIRIFSTFRLRSWDVNYLNVSAIVCPGRVWLETLLVTYGPLSCAVDEVAGKWDPARKRLQALLG